MLSVAVDGQPLAPGTQVEKGTTVVLVLSAGPAPRTVPKLVNTPYDQAKAALEKLGLVVTRLEDQFSDKIGAGSVISTDPAAGEKVNRGGTVNVVVSKGPDVVTVPPLAGLTLADATTTLQAAGLVVGDVAGPSTGRVVAASPAPLQVVTRGTRVNLLLA